MQEINEAYLILRDPIKRNRYDSLFVRTQSSHAPFEGSMHQTSYKTESTDKASESQMEDWITDARREAKELINYTISEGKSMIFDMLSQAFGGIVVASIIFFIMFSMSNC